MRAIAGSLFALGGVVLFATGSVLDADHHTARHALLYLMGIGLILFGMAVVVVDFVVTTSKAVGDGSPVKPQKRQRSRELEHARS